MLTLRRTPGFFQLVLVLDGQDGGATEPPEGDEVKGANATALALFAGGVVLIALGVVTLAPGLGPALFGEFAWGSVVAHLESSAERPLPDTYHMAVVEFRASAERTVRIERLVSTADSGGFSVGRRLRVAYFKGAPERAEIMDIQARWVSGVPALIFGGMLVGGGLLVGKRATGTRPRRRTRPPNDPGAVDDVASRRRTRPHN